jgi:hypothetical protein
MPDNKPYIFPPMHDGGKAERERLAARVCAAINDLANLDPRLLDLAGIVLTDIRALYPNPDADAGPTDPPPVPPKKP